MSEMWSLQSELLKHGFRPLRREIDRKDTRTKDKPKERLSDRELRELMGQNRPTYARGKGGAFRQR